MLELNSIFDVSKKDAVDFQKAFVETIFPRLFSTREAFNAFCESDFQTQIKSIRKDHKKIEIVACFPFRKHATKFFYEFLLSYLLPKTFSKITDFFTAKISSQNSSTGAFALVQAVLELDSEFNQECALMNLKTRSHEIEMGLQSIYQARRVFELQGESYHEKLANVQEGLTYLLDRYPNHLDYDIFSLMQQTFLQFRESFKILRETRYLIRMIVSMYFLKKQLKTQEGDEPLKRQVFIKFKRAKLHHPLGVKKVLGVIVGINFLRDYEVFSKKQLVKAIQNEVGDAVGVEESFLSIKDEEVGERIFYIEVEKKNQKKFLLKEVVALKKRLASRLIGRIEHLQRPIFMPRNEEEVMKNVVLLSGQLRFVKDFPQVIISFDEQSYKSLKFTVVLVRVLPDNCQNARLLLKLMSPKVLVELEREKNLGFLRQKYVKEALVMRITLDSTDYLREDDSIDLYRARQAVLVELERAFGHVRDFNGGMISKQAEALLTLKKALGTIGLRNKLLLENFFHSIYPIEMRSVIPALPLKRCFKMLLKQLNERASFHDPFRKLFESGAGFDICLIEFQDLGLKQKVIEELSEIQNASRQLVQLHLNTFDRTFLGCLFHHENGASKARFRKAINRALDISC